MLEKIEITDNITLKELRLLTGMSQSAFAHEVDIPFSTYRRYESNPSKMEVGQLFKICDTIGIPITKLII